ncbi:hypothetical protein TPHA_0N01470 [Tetrapisispora phaffii CBS 4417]|uniref:Superoxide dismutase 1 copper chaperone n=1 Tax=Tetrapisispora phaffii (strain ATCC 24235 / CBS 4417 / NBRC 1672 / NRRL Y-8282 / UCD 70-5) TaxID=1071381 RepID=G8C1A0_TETPH|nr:hypothetical protein TPHA_0N01470 [Tetrapisispora phaffii CBS 4417]CCE65928.1 hypothetical protein TPHA_0N01470 [Tetrapisispora phaffii CBS 4417]
MSDIFEATYAIAMHCEKCTNEIQKSLDTIPGEKEVEFNIEKDIMKVKSAIPPSTIIDTVSKDCKKDVIIRGAGASNGSAVCILESSDLSGKVKGLVRMVEINDGHKTLFDVTVDGVDHAGAYKIKVHENGDISKGISSCGNTLYDLKESVDVSSEQGKRFFGVDELPVWKLLGRSISVSTDAAPTAGIVGVVARSAGIWENDKHVCACSGKTIWEERKDALKHNIKH